MNDLMYSILYLSSLINQTEKNDSKLSGREGRGDRLNSFLGDRREAIGDRLNSFLGERR